MKQEVSTDTKKPAANKHYFKVPEDIFTSGLTKYEMLVCVYLLHLQNGNRFAFPGYEDIAKYCAISRRKAIRVVSGLLEKDIIRKQIETQAYRKNHSNSYVIVLNDKHHLKQL
jgi:hypothetical protein